MKNKKQKETEAQAETEQTGNPEPTEDKTIIQTENEIGFICQECGQKVLFPLLKTNKPTQKEDLCFGIYGKILNNPKKLCYRCEHKTKEQRAKEKEEQQLKQLNEQTEQQKEVLENGKKEGNTKDTNETTTTTA